MNLRRILSIVGRAFLTLTIMAEAHREMKEFGEVARPDPDAGERHAARVFQARDAAQSLWNRADSATED